MTIKTIAIETVAQAYLELLWDRGIENFFANAGTDFAPLIDAFARADAEGRPVPRPIIVPHENAAAAMAHGCYLATGKPQMVMAHVNVGTANVLTGIINAARQNIPILFTAGRTPINEAVVPGARDLNVHWGQETFDQAAMVREYVKWDYELRNFEQLEHVVDRAIEIAMTEPRGPVYLTLPREVIGQECSEFSFTSPPRRHVGGAITPDPGTVAAAADILAKAHRPLIITGGAGRDPAAVEALVRLAERFAFPVVPFNARYLCFPTNHPLHLGFNPHPFFDDVDAILVVDSEAPWIPKVRAPASDCQVIHMGSDPLFSRYPIRSFPCDVAVRAEPAVGLSLLHEALLSQNETPQAEISARRGRLADMHVQQRSAWKAELERVRGSSPLDPAWVSHCIDEIKNDDTVIVNEYDLDATQVEFRRPGTYYGTSAAGGLGWGLGAALGIKLGQPDRLVIATLGDGCYMFGNPTPCHFVSQAMGLPILTVIYNNRAWGSVRWASQRMYPKGWAARGGRFPLTKLEPSPDYEQVVTASGGYSERVEKPEDVRPALHRALQAVRDEKRQAVLNMVCKRPGEGN